MRQRVIMIWGIAWLAGSTAHAQIAIDNMVIDTDEIFTEEPKPWTAPGRLFAITLPGRWQVLTNPADARVVEFRRERMGQQGVLRVTHMQVPSGALPRQLMLNALDDRLQKLPSFAERSRRNLTLGGRPATAVTGNYSFQGNIQFPRVVEEVFVVSGTDAFILHFETFAPAAQYFASELNTVYRDFVVRPGGGGGESASAPNPAQPEVEPLPDPGY